MLKFNNYSKDPKPILHALTSFGEGMGERSICGAVSGALAGIGSVLNDKTISQKEVIIISNKFKIKFKARNTSLYCNELLSPYLNGDEPYPDNPVRLPVCTKAVTTAALIAQELVEEILNTK